MVNQIKDDDALNAIYDMGKDKTFKRKVGWIELNWKKLLVFIAVFAVILNTYLVITIVQFINYNHKLEIKTIANCSYDSGWKAALTALDKYIGNINNSIVESYYLKYKTLYDDYMLDNYHINLMEKWQKIIAETNTNAVLLFKQMNPRWVLKDYIITSSWGYRLEPIKNSGGRSGQISFHSGMDFVAKKGTLIFSDLDGIVYKIYHMGRFGYGNAILIKHPNGFISLYGHLSFIAVKKGQLVRQGEYIGKTGNTGKSNGAHLHYEIRFGDVTINPFDIYKQLL